MITVDLSGRIGKGSKLNIDGMSISDGFGLATVRDGLSNCEDKGPQFSFVMIVLNGMPFIEYSLKSVYDFAHEIIIVEGAVEKCMFAANAAGGSTDGTVEFIESFPDPQGKMKLVRGKWPEKCEMQNEALRHVTGNYVWLIDSDEVYKKEHLERIKGILRSDPSITQVNFIPDSFWKGIDYIFVSSRFFEDEFHCRRLFKYVPGAMFSTHRPPTMVWPGHDRTTEQMNLLDGTTTRRMGIIFYHYSYVLDKQVRQKNDYYGRMDESADFWGIDRWQWYEECFLGWNPANRKQIESRYPVWLGDGHSRTELFTGVHPAVMSDFIADFRSKVSAASQVCPIGPAVRQKHVLVSYITAPIRMGSDFNRFMFSNAGIARNIVKVLVDMGYFVDLIEYNCKDFKSDKIYDLFIGHGGVNWEYLSRNVIGDAVKIYFSTGIYWREWNRAEADRFDWLERRQGVRLPYDRWIECSEEFANHDADAIICLGNQHAADTYAHFPICVNINNASYADEHFCPAKKDFDAGRKRFVFFGSSGSVHKGLDRTIEAFAQLDAELYCVGLIEPDFARAYQSILKAHPRIHVLGWVELRSPQFYKLMNDCNCVIFPSCAEGQPGGVLECMNRGLIPIVSREANIDVKDFGVMLPSSSIEDIVSTVEQIMSQPVEWHREKSIKTRQAVLHDYSEETFYRSFRGAIEKIIEQSPAVQSQRAESAAKVLDGPKAYLAANKNDLGMLLRGEEHLNRWGRDDQTEQLLQRAIAVEPSCATAVCELGIYYANKGQTKKAAGLIGRALEFCPQDKRCLEILDRFGKSTELATRDIVEPVPATNDEIQSCATVQPGNIKNILWVRTDSIGDNVLAASMLPHIREKFRDAGITVVCQEHIAELYEACPFADEVVAFNRKRALNDPQYRADVTARLQELKPDLSLNSVYSREALTDWFALKCGAERSVALEGNLCNISHDIRDANNRLYTEVLPSGGEHKTELERHKDFLRGLGIEAADLQPIVWTRPSDEEFAEQIFRDNRLDPAGTVALFAGAQYDCRVYEGYGEALAEFCGANHLEIIALGAGREQAINQRNLDAAGVRAVNLSGKTSILESAAVLKRCRLALGAETGLSHICCAVGTPNVILLGGGHFGRFMPYSPLTSVVCLPLDCFGCNWDCRHKRPYCVKDVAPKVIAEALQQSFENSSRKIRVFVQGDLLCKAQTERPAWKTLEQFLEADNVDVVPVEARVNASPMERTTTEVARQAPECDVSIVLCTKDRAELLDRMLSSLEEAAAGIVYELIVIEGGSSDSTLDVLRRHNVWHVYDESQCLGPGRHSWPKLYNFGFSKALGKWAMYASDDIVFGPDSITRAVEMLDRQKEEVAGGVFFYKNLHPTRQGWAEYGIDFTRGNKLLLNYGLVRLDHFRECGGLEECYSFYCADTDLCYKLYEGGRQLIPLSGCFVTHDNLLDVQKRVNAGRSARDIELCRRRWRHFVPADAPKPTRLLWREDFAEAFNIPSELEKMDCGIESFWRGLAYFGQGMFAEAQQQFMQAVQSQCDHRQVLWYLALAADKCRDYAIAEKAATGAVRLAPDFEPALELLLRVTGTEQYSPERALCSVSSGSGDSVYSYADGGGPTEFHLDGRGWDGGQASPIATVVKLPGQSGPDGNEKELRREIARFNKVVVWGLKTSEHTHSHIHRHFFETLEKVGARAVFVDDTTDSAEVIGRNDLVIAVDAAISHLPIHGEAYYCLHNCPDAIHRRIAPARNIRLATYMNCAEQAGERWDEVTFFDSATRTLFQPWATDLLVREFKEPVLDRSGRIVFWIGSIWDDALGRGNVNEIQMLRDILEVRGIRFVHLRGISDSLNVRYVRNSFIAPAIVGRWQMANNYLPCRMWKNISYGQLGVSNVRKFDDIFEGCAVKGESIEELIDNALSLPFSTYRDMIYRQQEIVKERHTYVNRLLNIIKAFESIQNR